MSCATGRHNIILIITIFYFDRRFEIAAQTRRPVHSIGEKPTAVTMTKVQVQCSDAASLPQTVANINGSHEWPWHVRSADRRTATESTTPAGVSNTLFRRITSHSVFCSSVTHATFIIIVL